MFGIIFWQKLNTPAVLKAPKERKPSKKEGESPGKSPSLPAILYRWSTHHKMIWGRGCGEKIQSSTILAHVWQTTVHSKILESKNDKRCLCHAVTSPTSSVAVASARKTRINTCSCCVTPASSTTTWAAWSRHSHECQRRPRTATGKRLPGTAAGSDSIHINIQSVLLIMHFTFWHHETKMNPNKKDTTWYWDANILSCLFLLNGNGKNDCCIILLKCSNVVIEYYCSMQFLHFP